ncbi:MAG: hypothetical protein E6356_17275, partial [Terrisporobacter othiniensis]|nr:hypothetical protein [Terrisporobacter othiniensis]
ANMTYIPPRNNKAKNIKIEDSDNNFQSNDVEGALKELAENGGSGSGHTHINKPVLDTITQEKIDSWDDVTNKADKTEVLLSSKLNDNGTGVDELWSASKVNAQFNTVVKKTSVENGKLYLLQEDGIKIDTGTTLPSVVDSVEWSNIQNKPSVFTPEIHDHSYNDLTDKPTIPLVTNDLTNTLKTNYDSAYNHSQSSHAPVGAQKNSDITKEEIEAKLTGVISSHSHEGTSNEGGNNLIAKYIHNSNKEIIVTGFDQTTGEFTWSGSPSLSIGETLYLSPTKVNGIIDLTKIPIEFFNLTTTNGIFKVYSVSGNKFTLSDSTNTKISYATQTVDTNYFKFEDFTPFNITNIDTNKVKILINAMTNKNTYDELIIDTDNEVLAVVTTRLNISNKSYNVFNCEIILDLSNVFPLGFIKATIVQSRDGTNSNCRDIVSGATKYDSFPKYTIVTPSTQNIITNIGMNIRSNMLNGSTVVIYDLGGE